MDANQGQEYQEKILREQGLYKKPGEQVITVLPPANQHQNSQNTQKTPWWAPLQTLYNIIIGK